jgi:hypothetical protein
MYISKDPISLHGGDNLYAYVHDCNSWVDIFSLNDLQILANQAHSALPEGSQGRMVTAVGKDADGKLYMSSSSPYVPGTQKEWAKNNNVEVIESKKPNVHAEESLAKSGKGIVAIEPNTKVCIDCEHLMNEKKIAFETATTGKKSKNRLPGGKFCS